MKLSLRVRNQPDYSHYLLLVPKNYTQNEMLAEFDYSKPVKPLILQYSDDVLPSFNDSDNLIRLAKLLVYYLKSILFLDIKSLETIL